MFGKPNTKTKTKRQETHQKEARPREHKVRLLGQFLWDLVEKAKTIKDNNIRRKIDLAKTR